MLNSNMFWAITGSSGIYKDDFSGSIDLAWLADRQGWDNEYVFAANRGLYTYNFGGNFVICGSGGSDHSSYYNQPISNNQYSEVSINAISASTTYIGLSVRNSGNGSRTWYGWYGNFSTGSEFFRYVNGAKISIDTGGNWATGETRRLEIDGSTLRFYKNGALDTTMGISGIYLDPSGHLLQTGYPGLCTYAGGTGIRLDNWVGGSL